MCDARLESRGSSVEGEIRNGCIVAIRSDSCHSDEWLYCRIAIILESLFQSYGIGSIKRSMNHSISVILHKRFQFL